MQYDGDVCKIQPYLKLIFNNLLKSELFNMSSGTTLSIAKEPL